MKKILYFLGSAMLLLTVGCASQPVVVDAPVGPNPILRRTVNGRGGLQVFSRTEMQSEGDNPPWSQHTDYDIYDLQGKFLKHVGNTTGYYDQAPRLVYLKPGKYLVKAQAQDYLWVEVPVAIQKTRTTRVHLDDAWKLPVYAPKIDQVSLPDGAAVGWRDQSATGKTNQ